MPESSCFRTPFESQRVHLSQRLLKSTPQHLYPKFPLIQVELSQKTSLFVRTEILGLLGNRLTLDHMYSCHNWKKFMQHVQTPLCQKLQIFSESLLHFFNLHKILGNLKKKISFITSFFWRLLSPRNVVTWITENSCFGTAFESQPVHLSQTLLKSTPRHL